MSTRRAAYRGVVHLSVGLFISLAALFLSRPLLLAGLGTLTVLFVAFDLTRIRVRAANHWFVRTYMLVTRAKERSRLTGASYLLIGTLLTVAIFERDVSIIAISFAAIGDPAAGVIGRRFGTWRLFGKSLEGDASCLVACIIVGAIFHFAGLDVPLAAVLAGAIGATAVEAISLPVDDNLTMPLLAAALMTVAKAL